MNAVRLRKNSKESMYDETFSKGALRMSRRRNRPVVPGAERSLDRFKAQVMREKGYHVQENQPNQVKYEVAKELGVPLTTGYNGNLTSEQAGKVGGEIGGSMVKEMIKMAQQALIENQ
jgi:small acid-soluble spore protein D (minor alpha/beta-type SASP)